MTSTEIYNTLKNILDNINTGNLIAFLAIISSIIIPVALSLTSQRINEGDKSQINLAKIEISIIFSKVINLRGVAISFIIGVICSFIIPINEFKFYNISTSILSLTSAVIYCVCIGYIYKSIVRSLSWLTSKPSDINSIRNITWREYLEKAPVAHIYSVWEEIFKAPLFLEDIRYICVSIYLDKIKSVNNKFFYYSLLEKQIINTKKLNPNIIETIINNIQLDVQGVRLLENLLNTTISESLLPFYYSCLFERLLKNANAEEFYLCLSNLYIRPYITYWNDEKVTDIIQESYPEQLSYTQADTEKRSGILKCIEEFTSSVTAGIAKSDPTFSLKYKKVLDAMIGQATWTRYIFAIGALFGNCAIIVPDGSTLEETMVNNYINNKNKMFIAPDSESIALYEESYNMATKNASQHSNNVRKDTLIFIRAVYPFVNDSQLMHKIESILKTKTRYFMKRYNLRTLYDVVCALNNEH